MLKRFVFVPFFIIFSFSAFSTDSQLKLQARIYREEGYKLQNQGNLEGALSYYLKAVQIDPSYKEAYNDLGVVYEAQGNLDKAEAMYLKAIDIDSNYLAPYANLGFLYEKENQPKKAIFYWKKRYLLGRKGEYWTEKAREHLLKLGSFPEVRREVLEKEAATLSRELIYKREQQRLKLLEEAKMHFKLGFGALSKNSYKEAMEEFQEVINLNPPEKELILKAQDYYKKAQEASLRESIQTYLENSLNYLKERDYLSLMQELRKVLALIPEIPRE